MIYPVTWLPIIVSNRDGHNLFSIQLRNHVKELSQSRYQKSPEVQNILFYQRIWIGAGHVSLYADYPDAG